MAGAESTGRVGQRGHLPSGRFPSGVPKGEKQIQNKFSPAILPLESKFPAPKQNRSEPAEEGVGLKAISPERAGKCPRPARVEGTSAQARKLAEPAQNDGRWFAVEVWIFEDSGAPATAPPRSACGIPVGRAPEHCGAGLQALRASRRRRRTISAHWQGPSTACGTAQRSQCFRP